MHIDPAIPTFVAAILAILLLGVIMKKLKQPHVLVYLVAGIILGPSVLGVVTDHNALTRLGSFGVLLLLFFIGMEISPRNLAKNWVIPVIGTFLQIAVSVGVVALMGYYLEWPLARIILIGFVISLSSTAVVLKLLEDWGELNTRGGQNILGILLVQDLLIVPMLIILGFLGGNIPSAQTLTLQCIGGTIIFALCAWILTREQIRLPFLKYFGSDHEMQVFASLGICFGMALLTGLTELSSALGAFVGGMVISSAKETHWVHESLSSVRIIFIALFFVSVGMLIDLQFIAENWPQITQLVVAAFATNLLINAGILKALGEKISVSLYGGAMLSQIGEFSFVVAAVGFQAHIINQMAHQLIISVISITLLLSPPWIAIIKKLTGVSRLPAQRN